MKKETFWLIAIILLFGFSCSKKGLSKGDKDNSQGCLLIKNAIEEPNTYEVYSYNAQSRLVKLNAYHTTPGGDYTYSCGH